LEVLILSTLRAYAVGAAFSSRDADGSDDFAWRQVAFNSDDYDYRRPRPRRPTRPRRTNRRAASAVRTRTDPSAVRTRDQQKSVARSL
jgi:hypothetical protein